MKRRWRVLLILLTIQHVAFVAASVWLAPVGVLFAAMFLAWMVLPAFTAAIISAPSRHHIVAATVNGLVAAALLDYLFLVHGYFWPEPLGATLLLAFAYLLLGLGVSAACGAFVDIITKELDAKDDIAEGQRLLIAAKKGFRFSFLCAIVSTPVLLLLWPAQSSVSVLPIALAYSIGCMAVGVAGASIVGAMYTPPRAVNPIRTGEEPHNKSLNRSGG